MENKYLEEILQSEEMQNEKRRWTKPLTVSQQEYIFFIFARSGVEPVNCEKGLSCDILEAVLEAVETTRLSDNEIVQEILQRGNNKYATNKDKLKPIIVPPSDLIEFINFVISYILYQYNITSIPLFKEYDFNYSNYYLRNKPNLKLDAEDKLVEE